MTLFALLFLACPGPGLVEPGFDTGMAFATCTNQSFEQLEDAFSVGLDAVGCRWMVTATSRYGDVVLFLDVPAFGAAYEGESVSTTYTLPDETVRMEVRVGCGVDEGACAPSPISPEVVRVYLPTAGTVAVDVLPDGDAALADVRLTDVTLETEDRERVTMRDVEWTDIRLYLSSAD